MKRPEEFLSRGKGNFINCTDYDDAIQAMKDYAKQEVEKFISSKQDVMLSLPSDGETEKWFKENIGIVNDCSASSAIYKFRLWLKERGEGNGA